MVICVHPQNMWTRPEMRAETLCPWLPVKVTLTFSGNNNLENVYNTIHFCFTGCLWWFPKIAKLNQTSRPPKQPLNPCKRMYLYLNKSEELFSDRVRHCCVQPNTHANSQVSSFSALSSYDNISEFNQGKFRGLATANCIDAFLVREFIWWWHILP